MGLRINRFYRVSRKPLQLDCLFELTKRIARFRNHLNGTSVIVRHGITRIGPLREREEEKLKKGLARLNSRAIIYLPVITVKHQVFQTRFVLRALQLAEHCTTGYNVIWRLSEIIKPPHIFWGIEWHIPVDIILFLIMHSIDPSIQTQMDAFTTTRNINQIITGFLDCSNYNLIDCSSANYDGWNEMEIDSSSEDENILEINR